MTVLCRMRAQTHCLTTSRQKKAGYSIMYEEMQAQVVSRINNILDSLPEDKVTEKYEASALRDYTQTLININKLIDDSRKGETRW